MTGPQALWESLLHLFRVAGAWRWYLPRLPIDVRLLQQFSQGSAQCCGSLLLCMERGLPDDGFVMGLGLILLLDTFQFSQVSPIQVW